MSSRCEYAMTLSNGTAGVGNGGTAPRSSSIVASAMVALAASSNTSDGGDGANTICGHRRRQDHTVRHTGALGTPLGRHIARLTSTLLWTRSACVSIALVTAVDTDAGVRYAVTTAPHSLLPPHTPQLSGAVPVGQHTPDGGSGDKQHVPTTSTATPSPPHTPHASTRCDAERKRGASARVHRTRGSTPKLPLRW
jgi:hypothetical protein